MGRSILAIVAGFVVVLVLVILTTIGLAVLMAGGIENMQEYQPTAGYLAANLLTGFLSGMMGGFVTASIARRDRVKHAVALGVVMVIMSLLMMLAPNPGMEARQPGWYPWVIMIIGLLSVIVGGMLRARRGDDPPPLAQ